eukprot:scaffold216398_cov17-Tisochrysis_lutea.AAC.1
MSTDVNPGKPHHQSFQIDAARAGLTRSRKYGGNPVCSAAGRAVLRVVDQEQRQAHCHVVS